MTEIVVAAKITQVDQNGPNLVRVLAGQYSFAATMEQSSQFYVGRDVEVVLRFPEET